jgi:hypothetical protein
MGPFLRAAALAMAVLAVVLGLALFAAALGAGETAAAWDEDRRYAAAVLASVLVLGGLAAYIVLGLARPSDEAGP